MATDATGTPTSLGIPKFNTSVDAPSGLGSNAQMDAIDALLVQAPRSGAIAGIAVGSVPVWNGSAWVKPSGTPDGTKFLRDDGTWVAAGGSVPAGTVSAYAGASLPTGWLFADGSTVSQTTYAALFAAFGGHIYAADPGGGNFVLPDLRARVAVGKGTNAAVSTLGNNDGVTVANRRPQHRHTPHTHTPSPNTFSREQGGVNSFNGPNVAVNMATLTIGSSDGGSGVATDALDAPAYIVLNYIIKT